MISFHYHSAFAKVLSRDFNVLIVFKCLFVYYSLVIFRVVRGRPHMMSYLWISPISKLLGSTRFAGIFISENSKAFKTSIQKFQNSNILSYLEF